MSEKISRRELGKRSLLGAAALSVPGLLLAAQDPTHAPKVDPDIDRKVALIESNLAKPLSDKAKELLKPAIANNENNGAERLKHPLPENTEPCFMFTVTPVGGKK
jgi:hypothetical protein